MHIFTIIHINYIDLLITKVHLAVQRVNGMYQFSIQDILNNCKDTHWNLVRESSGTLGNASNARAVMIAINQQEFIIR